MSCLSCAQVFLPLLAFNDQKNAMQRSPTGSAAGSRTLDRAAAAGEGKRMVEPAKQAALRDEFLIAMDKFSAGIHRTIQQIEGEVSVLLII